MKIKIRNFFRAFIISILFSTIFSSCVTIEDDIVGVPSGSTKVFYDRGLSSLVSTKKHTVQVIPPKPANYYGIEVKTMPFFVSIKNNSKSTFNFDPTLITSNYKARKKTDLPIEDVFVYTPTDVKKLIQQRKNAAMFVAILGGAAGAYNAAQASTYSTYGYVGNTSFASTTYNSGLANALAIQNANQTADNINKINNVTEADRNSLDQYYLMRQTMAPNSQYGGDLFLSNPCKIHYMKPPVQSGGTLKIKIPIDNETHEFVFEITSWQDKNREKLKEKKRTKKSEGT